MSIAIRAPRPDEIAELFRFDGRNFGFTYTAEDVANRSIILEPERFRVAVDRREIVGATGTYSFAMTLPGGTALPAAGVTWVSVGATHRRQGVLTRLSAAALTEAAEHGDPWAVLTASEGGIYGRFGYGVATVARRTTIDRRLVQVRGDVPTDPVRFVGADEYTAVVPPIYDRYRTGQPGEITRRDAWWQHLADLRAKPFESTSAATHAVHPDGYVTYRIETNWNNGFPAHTLHLVELAATTARAHASLWKFVLGVDLVANVKSWVVPVDDPLPHLLTDPRALRTTELRDGVWVRLLDVPAVLGARTYGTDDELVIDVVDEVWPTASGRYRISGSPTGAACRRVRTRPDVVLPMTSLGALTLGGVRASALARAGQLTARSDDVLRRADHFFLGDRAPDTQSSF